MVKDRMVMVKEVNRWGGCRLILPSLVQYSGSITVLVGIKFGKKAEQMNCQLEYNSSRRRSSKDSDIVLRRGETREKRDFTRI
jgi:hypothetical protein